MTSGVLLSLLVGCESEADIAAEMERGLRSANEALLGALFTAETLTPVLAPAEDPVARHGTLCGECPCVSRNGLVTGPHQVTLDYEAGCLPTSGLLPVLLEGHTDVAWTGAEAIVAWANLVVAPEDRVAGTLGGPITLDGAATSIDAVGDFSIGDQGYDLDLALVVDEVGLAVDGEVDVAGARYGVVTLAGVELTYAGLREACPTPDAGRATLHAEDPDEDVIIDFAPGDGEVKVERDGRVSEAVEWCAYASERL